jgi:hypothetical protein
MKLITIKEGALHVGIAQRWVWYLIRVQHLLHTYTFAGDIYIDRDELECLVVKYPNEFTEWRQLNDHCKEMYERSLNFPTH